MYLIYYRYSEFTVAIAGPISVKIVYPSGVKLATDASLSSTRSTGPNSAGGAPIISNKFAGVYTKYSLGASSIRLLYNRARLVRAVGGG